MKIVLILIFFGNLLLANYNHQQSNKEKIFFCLYNELKHPIELLEAEDLLNKENIENLLYSKAHEDEYFFKALVLDYLYNGNNIEEYYKNAYVNSDIKDKENTLLYYAIYLQKHGNYKEAISLLRKLDIFASNKLNVPNKIAYAYILSNIKDDIKIESYLKTKKININKIKLHINECSK